MFNNRQRPPTASYSVQQPYAQVVDIDGFPVHVCGGYHEHFVYAEAPGAGHKELIEVLAGPKELALGILWKASEEHTTMV